MDKDTYSFIETFIVVVTFLVVDRLLSTKILGIASRAAELKNSINSLNEEMSGIVDEELLVAFLTRKTKDIFKTSTFEILKFD